MTEKKHGANSHNRCQNTPRLAAGKSGLFLLYLLRFGASYVFYTGIAAIPRPLSAVRGCAPQFYKEENMEMDQVWEKIKKGLKDGAALSMEKIEEYTKIGKLKIEEMAAKRKIERNFVDMGERAFELIVDGKGTEIENDLTVTKAIENIKELRQELVVIDEKIKVASEEAKARRPKEEDGEATGV
jgi:hypothetical protein